jgi:hypothetical protein
MATPKPIEKIAKLQNGSIVIRTRLWFDIVLVPLCKPKVDAAGRDETLWEMRIQRTCENDLPFVQLCARENLGLGFRRKRSGFARASPLGEETPFAALKSDIPG